MTYGTDRRTLLKGAGALALCGFSGPALSQSTLTAEERELAAQVSAAREPLAAIEDADFAAFADRFADAKVVLLGESTHGTDEFYRARAAITERLVVEHGFRIIAVEADWPDAARVDAYVRGQSGLPSATAPFQRFPVWMWRNRAVRDFVDRLYQINGQRPADAKVGFYGLDLYSLPSSMDAVTDLVRRHAPDALDEVRARYGCLAPWTDDPARYGALARGPGIDSCADEAASVVRTVLAERMAFLEATDAAYFNALQNAKVVAASEAYYRAMYEGSVASWNLRDTHMYDTLRAVLEAQGPDAKAVVWAHNSHIGDASATAMGRRGEINIGQLCKEAWGDAARLVGFGTDRGTVTAAPRWDGPTRTMQVRPSLGDSWGAVMRKAGDRFLLDFRKTPELRIDLGVWRPERFIGVIYRPETERLSHYAEAALARQFDAYLWFGKTHAVEPIPTAEIEAMPATYPFAL